MRESLSRLLSPRSVAVVGASEQRTMSNVAVTQLLRAAVDVDLDLHLVNPSLDEVYGRRAVAGLSELDAPVDAVLSLVSADKSVAVVEEAARLGCGGVVVVAGGFAELGTAGAALQRRLVDAANAVGMPVCGPNCTGFANVPAGVNLFTGTPVDVRPGGISLVSSSGYLMRAGMVAARERNLGVRLAVSSGNEAVTTLVDYLDFLVDDPATTVIAVVVEKLREPAAFFAAAARARAAGKPMLALKLGRSARARDIVRSHTGALTGESWVYDLAFRDAGIVSAQDIDDLMDRAAVLAQLPPAEWCPVERVAVLASSGGVAALTCDTIADEGIDLPALEAIAPQVREFVPDAAVVNPLDLTGFTLSDPGSIASVMKIYGDCEDVDAVVVAWWLGDQDQDRSAVLLEPARRLAAAGDTPVVLTTVEASRIGAWASSADADGVVFTRGLHGVARGLLGMHQYVTAAPRLRAPAPAVSPIPRPQPIVHGGAGPMLSFAASMRLLMDCGIDVAPWTVFDDVRSWNPGGLVTPGDRVVVKLADVAHRSDIGAVRLDVDPDQVPVVAAELAELARSRGLPQTVAVQRQTSGDGEAFIGFQANTELGSALLVGLGGVLVELTPRVVGRLLPVDDLDIDGMLDELGRETVFKGLRGARPWNREALATSLRAAADLGRRCAGWISSIDINPLICGPDGGIAVDALFLLED